MPKRQPVSVANKILLSYLVLIVCMLLLYTSYSIYQGISALNREIDGTISDYSYLLSKDARIQDMLKQGKTDPVTIAYLDDMLERIEKIDIIVVADENAIRLFHPEKERVGYRFEGGDEGPVLSGAPPYVVEGVGTRQQQRRAFTGIRDELGRTIGFVMVSAYSANIADMREAVIRQVLVIFAIASLVGLLLAWILSRNIKRTLLGLEPDRLTELYLQKEEVLDSLEEGIVAVDHHGELLTNAAARKMLDVSYDGSEEQKLQFIRTQLEPVQQNGIAIRNQEMDLSEGTILMDKIPVIEKGRQVGAVCVLRNKTEVQRLAEQLTGVNHIVAALRANTHEHINKLHVILGLIQMGDTRAAMEYIIKVKTEEEEDYILVMQRIENRTIAALLLGKKNRAKERDIHLFLRKDSYLEAHNGYLSTSDLVTVVGNLLENAMDAVEDSAEPREVSLFIHSSAEGLVIEVDDTGSGMAPEKIDQLFQRGFSTKGEGRGIGLHLVQQIVEHREGTIQVESEPSEGTTFSIAICKKRKRL